MSKRDWEDWTFDSHDRPAALSGDVDYDAPIHDWLVLETLGDERPPADGEPVSLAENK